MDISPKHVFRLDGLGAMVSLLLHVVIAFNEPLFGMPRQVVLYLAIIPTVLMCFSLYHYFRFPTNWQPSMRTIIIANLCFCFLSIALIGYFIQELTALGVVYFIGEVIVILLLVVLVELKVLRRG